MSEVWVWEYDDGDMYSGGSHLLDWEFFSSEAAVKAAAQDHADTDARLNKAPVVPLNWMPVMPDQNLAYSKATVDGTYRQFNTEAHTYYVAQLRFVR